MKMLTDADMLKIINEDPEGAEIAVCIGPSEDDSLINISRPVDEAGICYGPAEAVLVYMALNRWLLGKV